ncbi:unnamed protein product [Kluyveromyces dobzhanskii CBS 2104]|uniref:Serine/threonine-protein kinase TEL1 n=1 Tax=Kluyveromyces dobzhanskii CBS 2104 TaxID=1427455 RepID=A0A0A8L8F5_9SACH|nr:unnamed protein product [Kluyveromyces dobzhanskii CBS 2104]
MGIEDVAGSVIKMMVKYLSLVSKENTNTKTMMALLNTTLLKLHLIRFQDIINLSYYTMKHLLKIKLSSGNFSGEIARFNLMISEILYNKAPMLVGQNKDSIYVDRETIFLTLQDYIIHSLIQYDHTKLTPECVTFKDGASSFKFNWYNLSDICFDDSVCSEGIWLLNLSLVMMLNLNFNFLQHKEACVSGGSLLYKRRKVKDTFSHMVKDSLTYNDLLCNCIDSDSIKIKITGLQLTLFYLSIFNCGDFDLSQLKDALFQSSQNTDLTMWCLNCFVPFCSQQENSLSIDDETRLFKMCVPLLKSENTCKLSCVLLYKLIQYQSHPINDKSVLQQVSDLYLLSDVNGPALLCDESFKFWMCIHLYDRNFSTNKNSVTYIFSWLYSRWNQLSTPAGRNTQLHVFVTWICGRSSIKFDPLKLAGSFAFHDDWLSIYEERAHLVGVSFEIRTTKQRKHNYSRVICNEGERVRFMYKFFDLLDESDVTDTYMNRAVQVLKSIEGLVGDKCYQEYVSKFKEVFLLSSSMLDISQSSVLLSILESIISLEGCLLRHLIIDILPIDKLISTFMQKVNKEMATNSAQDDFSGHSPRPQAGNISLIDTVELGFQFILGVHSESKLFDPLSSFLMYSKDLSLPTLIRVLPNLLKYLNRNENNISPEQLEKLTQFLGSSLLTPGYDKSSNSINILTEYLRVTSRYWVKDNTGRVLTADCNDILDWIFSQYEESTFSSIESLYELAGLMAFLLDQFDLSNSSIAGGKQRVFKIFSGCAAKLPKYLTNRLANMLKPYIKRVGVTNQRILFKELLQRFSPPHESIEAAAFYSLTCKKLSDINEFYMVNSILHLLDNTNFPHVICYVEASVNSISTMRGFTSNKDLFHQCRLSIIDQWFDRSAKSRIYEPSIWRVDLFGFEFDEFCIRYQLELTSFFFAKSSTYYYIVDHLKTLLNMKQEALLSRFIASTIALSHIESGVKDLIFDIAEDLLGRKFSGILKGKLDDLVYHILKLTDLSNFNSLLNFWSKLFTSSCFKHMLCSHSSTYMQLQDNVTISFPIVYKLLKKNVLSNVDNRWSFDYTIQRLIMDLQNCVLVDQKIRVLRQIKLLILLFEDYLVSFKDFDPFLLEISKLLFNVEIFPEVKLFVVDLLDFSATNRMGMSRSLAELMRYLLTVTDGTVKNEFLPRMKPVMFKLINSKHDQLYSACYALLSREKNCFGWGDIENVFKFRAADSTTISLLSDLFNLFDYDHSFNASSISPDIIKNLVHLSNCDMALSDQLKKWMGNFLGDVVCVNSYSNLLPTQNYSLDLKADISSLMEFLWLQYQNTEDITLRFLLDHIQYIILSDDAVRVELDAETCSSVLNMSTLTRITWEKFEDCHGVADMKSGEAFLTTTITDACCGYTQWLSAFFCSTLLAITDQFPSLRVLSLVNDSAPFKNTILLSQLVKILMVSFPRQRISVLSDLFNRATDIEQTKDSKPKMKVIVELLSLIRGMALTGVQNAVYVYDRIDLKPLIPIALSLSLKDLSLMLYEEYYGNLTESDALDYDLLYRIYSSIDEKDLFYGLPLSSSLSSSLTLISKTKFNSHTNFALSNGRFEEAIRSRDSTWLHDFASIVSSNGFTGLANTLDNNFENTQLSEDRYLWALKLNNWEFPVPEVPDSFAKSAFSILKDVKDVPNFSSFDDHILKVVNSGPLIRNDALNIDTMESLGLLASLKKIGSSKFNPLVILNTLRDYDESNADYLPGNFFDIKYWSRHFFIESRLESDYSVGSSSQCNPSLHLAKVLNLVHSSTFYRNQGRLQDFISIVMTLEDAVNRIATDSLIESSDPLFLFCKRASILESARMLWASKESTIAINMLEDILKTNLVKLSSDNAYLPHIQDIMMSDVIVDSQLVEWSSYSKHRSPEVIFNDHILHYEREVLGIRDHSLLSSVCYTYAEFCYKERQKMNEEDLTYLKQKITKVTDQLEELSAIFKNTRLSDAERKDAKRHRNRLMLQNRHDRDRYNKISSLKSNFVSQALHFFLTTLVHSNSRDAEVVDKFCSLWFSHSTDDIINSKLQKEIGTVPSFKFLPWVSQMASKLADSSAPFQDTLQLTLKRMLYKLPYETLYPLISMSLQDSESRAVDPVAKSRVAVVHKIVAALNMYDSGQYGSQYTRPVQEFCAMSVALACYKIPPKSKFLQLDTLNIGKYWLETLPMVRLPLPTVPMRINSSQDGRREGRRYISSVDSRVVISSSGLSLPKIAVFTLSDGTKHRVLLKGSNDDLRQDAIMEQVFKQVNKILTGNKETRKQKLGIRTYEVIPIGARAGLIEFVANSISLHDILLGLHSNDEISFDKARKTIKASQNLSVEERVLIFSRITEKIKPKFRQFFFQSFLHAHDWYKCRKLYTNSVVTSSIVGYLLGLGDRHLNNVLIDVKTGESIHIDLGVAFDQGKLLPIPELVPFRLTRDIVDGFGVTGIEGPFRKNCERVFKVLRDEKERLMCVLNVLKWDPLYSWKMTPLKKQRLQAKFAGDYEEEDISISDANFSELLHEDNNNDESIRALKGVESKLHGDDLSVEAVIQELLSSATDIQNLATIYMGWSAFY